MVDISDTKWSETDASNNQAAPDGWTSGTMLPTQVEPTGRAMMGAIKRFWNRVNGTVTTAGDSTAYTYATVNGSFPTAYVNGEKFSAFFHTANTITNPTLAVDALAAKTLVDQSGAALVVGAINGLHDCAYDGTDIRILNPLVVTALPTGAILDFGGTSAPAGFLLCDGSSILRADQPALFTAIGTTWGSVDGTHFNVPDFRRRSSVGSGGTGTGTLGNAVGNTGGEETHTLLKAELPSYNLTVTDPGHVHDVNFNNTPGGTGSMVGGSSGGVAAGAAESNTTGITVASDGSGTAFNEYSPVAVVLKIIKT